MWRSFHLSLVGLLKQTVSIDLLGVGGHSIQKPPFVRAIIPLVKNKGQSMCVNQLVARIWTPAPTGEDPIIFACYTALQRERRSLRHHAQIWQRLLSVYLPISLSSPWDLAASAVRLINRSHQQEVLRPIRLGKTGWGQAGVRLCVNTEACLPLGRMDKE